jgi:hypothetical protein
MKGNDECPRPVQPVTVPAGFKGASAGRGGRTCCSGLCRECGGIGVVRGTPEEEQEFERQRQRHLEEQQRKAAAENTRRQEASERRVAEETARRNRAIETKATSAQSASTAAPERRNRAFTSEHFWAGVGAAKMLAQSQMGNDPILKSFSDALSLVIREALEEILAEHLNSGRWDSLPFRNGVRSRINQGKWCSP